MNPTAIDMTSSPTAEEGPGYWELIRTVAIRAGSAAIADDAGTRPAAPLLGLLGTVSGLISMFQVITQYGVNDPKLLAGGIGEPLYLDVITAFSESEGLLRPRVVGGRTRCALPTVAKVSPDLSIRPHRAGDPCSLDDASARHAGRVATPLLDRNIPSSPARMPLPFSNTPQRTTSRRSSRGRRNTRSSQTRTAESSTT